MLKIGLTGGIGSGKSTVARLFQERGVPVFDADQIARTLVRPGQPTLERVIGEFGTRFLTGEGELDRARLRDHVFCDPKARARLEAILHPAVFTEMSRQANGQRAPYCLFAIPLLVESNAQPMVDRILVVDCPERLQIERVRQRDGLDEALIRRILASQASRQERLSLAHDIIVNDGDLFKLEQQVKDLHRYYCQLCQRNHHDP